MAPLGYFNWNSTNPLSLSVLKDNDCHPIDETYCIEINISKTRLCLSALCNLITFSMCAEELFLTRYPNLSIILWTLSISYSCLLVNKTLFHSHLSQLGRKVASQFPLPRPWQSGTWSIEAISIFGGSASWRKHASMWHCRPINSLPNASQIGMAWSPEARRLLKVACYTWPLIFLCSYTLYKRNFDPEYHRRWMEHQSRPTEQSDELGKWASSPSNPAG